MEYVFLNATEIFNKNSIYNRIEQNISIKYIENIKDTQDNQNFYLK